MTNDTTMAVSGICTGTTEKAVFLTTSNGNKARFPKSQITLVEGEYTKGAHIKVDVPKWLVDRARQDAEGQGKQQDINPSAKVLVTGTLVDRSEKALQIRCDADMVSRWLALSRIEIEGDMPTVPGAPVRATVPAWMLLHNQTKHYPSWVAGAQV